MTNWARFLVTALIWGASFLFIKFGLEGFEPFTLVAIRTSVASVFLVLWCRGRGLRLPREPRVLALCAGLGLLTSAIPFLLITWGEKTVDSGIASVLNSTTPLFTMLLTHLIHRSEGLTPLQNGGVLLGFGGVLVIVGGGGQGTLAGGVAILGGALSYGICSVLFTRFLRGYDFVAAITVGTLASAVVTMTGAALIESPALGGAPMRAWMAVLALGLLGTGVAYVLYMQIIWAWGATRSSMITYAIPPIGVALGAGVRGEPLTPSLLLGGALIAAGVVGASRGARSFGSGPRPVPRAPVARAEPVE